MPLSFHFVSLAPEYTTTCQNKAWSGNILLLTCSNFMQHQDQYPKKRNGWVWRKYIKLDFVLASSKNDVVCALIPFPFCCKFLYSWFRYTPRREMKLMVVADKNNLSHWNGKLHSARGGKVVHSWGTSRSVETCNVQNGIVWPSPNCQPENALYVQFTSLMLSNHLVTSPIHKPSKFAKFKSSLDVLFVCSLALPIW